VAIRASTCTSQQCRQEVADLHTLLALLDQAAAESLGEVETQATIMILTEITGCREVEEPLDERRKALTPPQMTSGTRLINVVGESHPAETALRNNLPAKAHSYNPRDVSPHPRQVEMVLAIPFRASQPNIKNTNLNWTRDKKNLFQRTKDHGADLPKTFLLQINTPTHNATAATTNNCMPK
jgi:hypothetical protein